MLCQGIAEVGLAPRLGRGDGSSNLSILTQHITKY